MGLRARLTPRAITDLEDIRAYLEPRSPQGAENVRRSIEQTIDTLSDFPGLGRGTDIPDIQVLPVVFYPYLVYHAVVGDELVIAHIRHGARAAPTRDDLA
jgi:plasmid stabilization system protein ParE